MDTHSALARCSRTSPVPKDDKPCYYTQHPKLTFTQRMDRFREWDQERQSVERLMAGSHADNTPYGTREELKAAHDILRKSAMDMARGISASELREAVERNEVSCEDLVRLDKFIGTFRRRERSRDQDQGPER